MSPSTADSSSSASSPEPNYPLISSKGKKTEKKSIFDHGKNEGVDPNWSYKPPLGFSLVEKTSDAGEFDWDAIANDEDLDLWLIRVPDSVKPKYLENMRIEVPPASKTSRIGTVDRKHAIFDIWAIGDDDDHNIGGEEIKGLSCLLPRKSNGGKLYPAPKPVARHIVLSAQAVVPAVSPSSDVILKGLPRECYPKELLKHKFIPYGSLGGMDTVANEMPQMDVDVPIIEPTILPPSPKKMKHKQISKSNDVSAIKHAIPSSSPKKIQHHNISTSNDISVIEPAIPPPTPKKIENRKPSTSKSEKAESKKNGKRKGDSVAALEGKAKRMKKS